MHANSDPVISYQSAPTDLFVMESMSLTSLVPVKSPESIVDVPSQSSGETGGTGTDGSTPVDAEPALASPAGSPTTLSPGSPSVHLVDVSVPRLLLNGIPMLKVSAKKQKQCFFKLDPDQGQILWYTRKLRIIPIESIKEIRTGADARYYREQFQLAQSYEDRWFTLVYVLDSEYKTLHLIATTRELFVQWDSAVRRLYEVRKKLMSGLGHGEMRQAVWEKQFWKGADGQDDHKLDFEEVVRMCRRLNITPSRDDLLRRFSLADSRKRGYLDFADFRKFVTALKARNDIEIIFKELIKSLTNGTTESLTYPSFVRFMREVQKSKLTDEELEHIFLKYASSLEAESSGTSFRPPASPARNALELAIRSEAITAGLNTPSLQNPVEQDASQLPATLSASLSQSASLASEPPPLTRETGVWTCKSFTSFLLSPENSAFKDEKQDMTRPLPEYFISSSHNTYLVGHQLVGESTIEGYARALLHGCRSVELDIYDGETEPVIYHGKTLTSKVSLRNICETIARYAFVTSPYPIIISAEVHCSVPQQVMVANIMIDVFRESLVRAHDDVHPKIEALPSPEDLKGKVLLKVRLFEGALRPYLIEGFFSQAKNLYVSDKEALHDKDVVLDTESSSTETSASDTDFKEEVRHEWRKARANEAEAIKGFKSELSKAKKVLERVKPRRNSENLAGRPAVSPSVSPVRSRNEPAKVKMSPDLVRLLVYTVGVKCRGINKKEVYAPEQMFSLSENTANRILKQNMMDLIKHNKTHLIRIYPKGTRIGSTNYEPHRYWSAGAQLVAINWQTYDLGYMLNHAMFQRNHRAGYVLKPLPLRNADKQLLSTRTKHTLSVTVISAQQLPRPKDSLGRDIIDKSVIDPYVEISLHIPDWTPSPYLPTNADRQAYSPPSAPTATTATSARTFTVKTTVVKNNGWNPVWQDSFSIPFDCVGGMLDLVFVKFAVKQEGVDEESLGVYCTSLANLAHGYRHLPLHDAQLSQYLFSTLFVKTSIRTTA
ncbi:hypothetical protein NM688_g8501 [Phlebia brevispora]|uniref:Uncharacterized protein n=1 Tax=Phlebia brevispora TaxID=194682 RepID=A0ACC1RSR8_9APHY|nr:hypothetical protein NM688_g8501 [Phlebia brevispora]